MTQLLVNLLNAHHERDPILKFIIEIVFGTIAFFLFVVFLLSTVAFYNWDGSIYTDPEVYKMYRAGLMGGACYAALRGFCMHIIPLINSTHSKETS